MLYYHAGLERVWCKPPTVLENKNHISIVKFGKLSVIIWGGIFIKGVGVIRILDEVDTQNIITISLKKFT